MSERCEMASHQPPPCGGAHFFVVVNATQFVKAFVYVSVDLAFSETLCTKIVLKELISVD